MTNDTILEKPWFWNVLKEIEKLEEKIDIEKWCQENGMKLSHFHQTIEYLESIHENFYNFLSLDHSSFSPPSEKIHLTFKLSGTAWIISKSIIDSHTDFKNIFEVDISLKNPFKKEINAIKELSLIDTISFLNEIETSKKNDEKYLTYNNKASEVQILNLEMAIKKTLSVEVNQNSLIHSFLPRKIAYLEGGLNVIGETISDKRLICLPIYESNKVKIQSYIPEMNFSSQEIDDFIYSLKSMNDQTVRLVLKIFARDKFSENYQHQFADNPCLMTNQEGDYIWAATLEPSEDVYDWLFSLFGEIEILFPVNFKRDFLNYCEDKLKKLA